MKNIFKDEAKANISENIQPLLAFHSKDSFGDMDIVICSEFLLPNYIEYVVSAFGLIVGDWSKNGNVLSFAYKNFQIDLIISQRDEFQSSLNYFHFNDVGNLCGRLAKKLGIKYGHKGCELIVRDGDQVIGEILLDRDNKKLLEILGLNYDKWIDGFFNLEDIFRWVSSSKYFNKEIYLLDNRNHYSRTRDAKRKTYHEFLEWCKDREFINNYPHSVLTEKNGYSIIEPYFIDVIIPTWPHVKDEYESLIKEYVDNKILKSKISGGIVMMLSGLEGKDLGIFMTHMKRVILENNLKHVIMKIDQQCVNSIIKSIYSHYQNNWKWGEIPIDEVLKSIHGDDYVPNFEY